MSKKMKIKFKHGKAKIKLKGDDALPVQGAEMQQLLGSVLQRAVPLPDTPAPAAAIAPPETETATAIATETATEALAPPKAEPPVS